jgi:predicted permease
VILLLGAGLFVRTLDNLQRVELGVNTEGVVTFFARPAVALENARKAHVYRTLLEGLAAVPGVIAIGANTSPLFTGARSDGPLAIEGPVTGAEGPYSLFNGVTPGYFEALGLPIHAGSAMTWDDWGTGKRIAFVNQAVASAFFQGSSPLGRRIGRGTRAPTEFEIVGVVGNNRHHELRGDMPRQTFFNLDSRVDGISRISVYARVAGDPRQAMASLRAAAHRIDPNMVMSGMRTLEHQLDTQMANETMLSFLSIGFAVLATILAIVGVYGVLVFQVARRTREIGVRMALGARRGLIVRLVAGEMLYVVPAGLAAGLVIAYLCGRYVQSQLFGLEADDPLVFAAAVGLILSGATAATLIPAWRASRIDAMHALRHE